MKTRLGSVALICLALASCSTGGQDPVQQAVNIGTHTLQAHTMGEGSATVVIDVGIAGRTEEWHPVQRLLADEALVILYDRAGYGGSQAGPLPRDSSREADELKALLEALSVEGPLVLVGHSLGALNAQVFADQYPGEVSGLVLIDPPPLGWLLGDRFPDLHRMAEEMTDEWQMVSDRGQEATDPEDRAEAIFFQMIASEHREMFGESARRGAAIQGFGSVPLVVIASGVPNPMFGEDATAFQHYWSEQSREVASKSRRGRFVLAEEHTHHLHVEAVELVVEQILSVLADVTRP